MDNFNHGSYGLGLFSTHFHMCIISPLAGLITISTIFLIETKSFHLDFLWNKVNHEKTLHSFPWNAGWLLRILMSWFIRILIYTVYIYIYTSCNPLYTLNNQGSFFHCSGQVADQMCRWPNLHQEAHRPSGSWRRESIHAFFLGSMDFSFKYIHQDVPNLKWLL